MEAAKVAATFTCGDQAVASMNTSATSAEIRSQMSSQTCRTTSMGWPAGSEPVNATVVESRANTGASDPEARRSAWPSSLMRA